jgi:ABC-2 type transport system ATP-binding protein
VSEAVELRSLTKDFGKLRAVDGLDLSVHRGEMFALVGPDGAGKTTSMRLICGAMLPSGGEALVEGVAVTEEPERVKRMVGYMSQRFSLYGELSVAENLRFFADLRGVKSAERIERSSELLFMTRLQEFTSRRAEQLSGGMKQKLALACTLIHVPRLLLLDEPTTGVDPVSRREFWRILHNLKKKDVTILVSTPYMDEAERCDRVGFVHHGRLITAGTPDELLAGLEGGVLRVYTPRAFAAQKLLRDLPGVESVQMFGDRLHLLCEDPRAVGEKAGPALRRGGHREFEIEPAAPTLEDVFVSLTRQDVGEEQVA